jgi:dephospho-CoA kinase
MLFVALTGGYASGKSHVGRMLQKLGCHIIQADELGHRVLEPGGDGYPEVIKAFGGRVLDDTGAIDRRKLASVVFEDPRMLAMLNAIIHPAVRRMEKELVDAIVARDPRAIVVVEAAIHIETGGHSRFDKLILTVCGEAEQIRRAMKRDRLSEQEVRARLSQQLPVSEKRKFADYIIDTSGSEESTWEQTVQVYNSIKGFV